MHIREVFYSNTDRVKAGWRILIFTFLLFLAVLPLLLVNNSYLQFCGALLLLIIGLYFNSKYLDKRAFSQYGLVFNKASFVDLIIGILIGAFSVILILIIGKALGILTISDFVKKPMALVWLAFAFKMLLIAILEETFFRGYLFTNIYDGLKSKNGPNGKTLIISVLLSSVFFGLAHINNNNASLYSVTFLTINGIVWCIPFIITKTLGLSIGLHAAWNFTQTQLGFTMSGNKSHNPIYKIENIGPEILNGGEYGPEAGIIGLIGFATMLLISLAYIKLKKDKNVAQQRG